MTKNNFLLHSHTTPLSLRTIYVVFPKIPKKVINFKADLCRKSVNHEKRHISRAEFMSEFAFSEIVTFLRPLFYDFFRSFRFLDISRPFSHSKSTHLLLFPPEKHPSPPSFRPKSTHRLPHSARKAPSPHNTKRKGIPFGDPLSGVQAQVRLLNKELILY